MTRSRKTIVFVHLLNDYSGSPLVLSHAIDSLPGAEYKKILYTSTSAKSGFLSGLDSVETRYFRYRWKANGWLRLMTYTLSQVLLFFQLLRLWRKEVVIYINTLLPFGAALAGKLMGKKIIYHLHETSMKPPALKSFLRLVANHTADKVIYVSHYLEAVERLSLPGGSVVYNSLSPVFRDRATMKRRLAPPSRHCVLMLCSLKEYKGVGEFLVLAGMLPFIGFELVLNSSRTEMERWLAGRNVAVNCAIFPTQSDTHPFYQRATIVINLSHPDKWVETFGMTILEGMAYGLPAIVPTTGGVRELVEEGVNGFSCDYRELERLAGYIRLLANDPEMYRQFSEQALIRSELFSESAFGMAISSIVRGSEKNINQTYE
jgi:glycosyltransferase involved in cell wall biosynthesis